MSETKQVSVRVPIEVLKVMESKGAVASYILNAVKEKIAREYEAEIAASLACLAEDPEANDISHFVKSQRKVMRRGD